MQRMFAQARPDRIVQTDCASMRNLSLFAAAGLTVGLLLQACGSDGDPAIPGNPDGGASNPDGGGNDADGAAGPRTILDVTCAGSGRASFPVGVGASEDLARGVSRRSDGSTLLVGTVDEPTSTESIQDSWFAGLKLKADCTIDTSYGSNGLAFFSTSNPDYQVEEIHRFVPNADGSALFFGTSTQPVATVQGFAVTAAKLTAGGQKDATFGVPFTPIVKAESPTQPETFTIKGVEAAADGTYRIIAQTTPPFDGLAFLTFDGTKFDAAKTRLVPFTTLAGVYEPHRVESFHTYPDGSMLIAGTFDRAGGTSQLPGVLKLKPDGTVDTTFGTEGVAGTGPAGAVESRTFLAVQPDGKILLAATLHLDDHYQSFGVMRFDAAGTIDLAFGTGGVALVDIGTGRWTTTDNVHTLEAFHLGADGSMLLAGEVQALDDAAGANARATHVGVARFLANGTLDPAFVEGGTFDGAALAGGKKETLDGLDLDASGTLSLAATHENAQDDSDWVIYRFVRQP